MKIIDLPSVSPTFSSAVFHDALYDHYRGYLRDTPVFRSDVGGVYLSRFEDCVQLLDSPACKRSPPGGGSNPFSQAQRASDPLETMIQHWMVFMDPPRHDVLRKAFMPMFTARSVTSLETFIGEQVRELLATWPTSGRIEAVQQLAFLLPMRVIAAMLGVPASDAKLFQAWAVQLTEALDTATEASLLAGSTVALELKTYFTHLIAARKTLPAECLINLTAEKEGSDLTAEDLLYGCTFLLWAGHETTKNLIANGLLLLAQHPQQRALLQQRPELTMSAIEEMLRYECPVQKISRWTHAEVAFGEYRVPAGTLVTALIGAAHRDPAVFDAPDTFDITRQKNRHIAFGTGIHHCLGALLARTEARIVFAELVPRLESLEVVDYRWRTFSAFRSLDWLNLEISLRGPGKTLSSFPNPC